MVDKKNNQVIYCTVEEKEYLKRELEKYRLKKKADELGLSVGESTSTTSTSTSDTTLKGTSVTKIDNLLRDEIRLGLIMFGYERDRRADDPSDGNEMHWVHWIQNNSSYPQDEKKIDAILDRLCMKTSVNPFVEQKRAKRESRTK